MNWNTVFLLAYVSGERKGGLILETPCKLDESSNKAIKLDIEIEQKVIEETLNEFRSKKSTEETITLAMKDLGLKRYEKFDRIGLMNVTIFF